jgi:hypothetical protein
MRPRVLIAVLALVAAPGLVAAGCAGSDADSGERTDSPPPASGPSTAPPPAPPPATHAAPELEALLPSEIDGVALTKGSATGADVFGSDAFSREMTRFLAGEGRKPADLRFANALDASQTLDVETGVFQASGVDARALKRAIVASSRPSAPGLTTSTAMLGGKRVTTLGYASGSTLYLYEQGDRVFYVGTRSEELASSVLAMLP